MHTFLTKLIANQRRPGAVLQMHARVFKPFLVGPIFVFQMAAVGFGSVCFDALTRSSTAQVCPHMLNRWRTQYSCVRLPANMHQLRRRFFDARYLREGLDRQVGGITDSVAFWRWLLSRPPADLKRRIIAGVDTSDLERRACWSEQAKVRQPRQAPLQHR
ncbi:hypothetical protein NKH52_32225 [Mesorhizobium sp. M1066]|uniref:hypothetical protein n=1 Tax=unclassified Mesorhizobium TaxID=325217 RepID=UPI003336ABE4